MYCVRSVEFRSIAEWEQISRKLIATPDVSDVDVQGLSGRGARIALRYPGGGQALAEALTAHGLVLRNAGGGWVLSAK